LQQHLQKTIVIVAHGTIISLFAARHAFVEPFPLWQSLVLPSFVVLSSETISLQPLAFSFALVAVSR
ncbi:MAG: hypothetical protein ACR2PL_23210, partial [Dehalococcoidia bacterium]